MKIKKKCWHDNAKDLFYKDRLTLVEMEKVLGVTRKTISKFLQSESPNIYKAERERRKVETEIRSKEAKRVYAENNPEKVRESQVKFKANQLGITPEEYENYLFVKPTLKDEIRQQHEDDVGH